MNFKIKICTKNFFSTKKIFLMIFSGLKPVSSYSTRRALSNDIIFDGLGCTGTEINFRVRDLRTRVTTVHNAKWIAPSNSPCPITLVHQFSALPDELFHFVPPLARFLEIMSHIILWMVSEFSFDIKGNCVKTWYSTGKINNLVDNSQNGLVTFHRIYLWFIDNLCI